MGKGKSITTLILLLCLIVWVTAGSTYFFRGGILVYFLLSVIGVVYALITIFVMANEWKKYNELDKIILWESNIVNEMSNYIKNIDESKDNPDLKHLINSYDKLIQHRIKKTDGGISKIPLLLTILILFISMVFVLFGVLHVHMDEAVFFFTVFSLALFIMIIAMVAFYSDKPFGGLWGVHTNKYRDAIKYENGIKLKKNKF